MLRLSGPAQVLFDRPWADPPARTVSILEPDGPALVLGSTQPDGLVDGRRAAAAGVDVVRRRSGGGAVLLRPAEVLWVDVVVPAGDRLWSADVGRAFWWLGEAWCEALAAAGVPGAHWHQGPLLRSPRSDQVCFAGLGPGEVTVGVGGLPDPNAMAGLRGPNAMAGLRGPNAMAGLRGPNAMAGPARPRRPRRRRKVVGISQRRTRAGALFQCAALLRWSPAPLIDLLRLVPEAAAELEVLATGVPVGRDELEAEFVAALARR